MNTGIISNRYAHAIYEYAAEKGEDAVLYKEMQQMAKHFIKYPALRKVMSDPTISSKEKINVLIAAYEVPVHETLKQVIRMVVENGRASFMENIAWMYDEVYRKAKGIVIVHLATVEPISEKIKEALIPIISKETKEQIEFHTETDAGLIGGFVLEIKDKRLDASVKNQLRMMNYKLKEKTFHFS
jgi:F-type H+-transporting ATPase subunit delta